MTFNLNFCNGSQVFAGEFPMAGTSEQHTMQQNTAVQNTGERNLSGNRRSRRKRKRNSE